MSDPISPDRVEGDVSADLADAPTPIVVLGLGAALIGIVLRFVSRSPMWLDEALTVSISKLPLSGSTVPAGATGATIFEALRHDGHPPLFYVLLHGWMSVFGTSNLAVRSLSGLFGVLCLPLAFLIGRRRGGSLLGWLAVAVVALSPFAVRYSDEARMYSLVMLLVFVGWLLLDDILRLHRSGPVRLLGLALTTAALLYTQYWALWICAATGLLVLRMAFRSAEPASRTAARRAIVALGVGLVLFLPWIPTMLYQSAHTGTPWASAMRPTAMVAWTFCTFAFGDYADAALFAATLFIMVVLALFGRAISRGSIEIRFRPRPQLSVEAFIVGAVIIISTVMSFLAGAGYAPRYAAVYFPLVAVLVAAGISRFIAPRLRLVVALVVLLPLLGGSALSAHETRSQSRQIVDAVGSASAPGDLLVVCPDQLGPAISRELDLRASGDLGITALSYPTSGDPHFVDWVDYSERNDAADPKAFAQQILDRSRQGGPHSIFFVLNGEYRTFDGDCEAVAAVLGSTMNGTELVSASSSIFEHATLIEYRPRP